MIVKVSVPNCFQFKFTQGKKTSHTKGTREIHYIGGAEVLPPPLELVEEGKIIDQSQ